MFSVFDYFGLLKQNVSHSHLGLFGVAYAETEGVNVGEKRDRNRSEAETETEAETEVLPSCLAPSHQLQPAEPL